MQNETLLDICILCVSVVHIFKFYNGQQIQDFIAVLNIECHFYFLLPISRESIVLGGIFEIELLMDLHVLRSHESEKSHY